MIVDTIYQLTFWMSLVATCTYTTFNFIVESFYTFWLLMIIVVINYDNNDNYTHVECTIIAYVELTPL